MRHSSEPSDILVDGIHINFILTLVYFGSYTLGMQRVCLASFITILLNSMYMITVIYPDVPKEPEVEGGEDEGDKDTEEDEGSDLDTNLSLKQREHGAVKSKSLSDEADAVLYEKLYQIVEETQRRNDARCRALTRTPTSSSLVEPPNSDDEYADMPPLIDANSVLRYRGQLSSTSKNVKNNTEHIKKFLDGYTSMDEVD
jgi:hypothetical protein